MTKGQLQLSHSKIGVYHTLIFVMTFLSFSPLLNAFDELSANKAVADMSVVIFERAEYERFNVLEEQYRTQKTRLLDGRWKLPLLFKSLADVDNRNNAMAKQHKIRVADQWIAKTPSSPAPYLAKAAVILGQARSIQVRATTGAKNDKVARKMERWAQIRYKQARKILEDSAAVSKQSPVWFVQMATIAKYQYWKREQFEALYSEASTEWPSYHNIHTSAYEFYEPIWEKNPAQRKQFIDNAVALSQKEEGLGLYARLYWAQLEKLGDNTIGKDYADWKQLHQSFNDIEKRYPNSEWNLNAHLFYACMAQDWKAVKTLIPKFKTDPHLAIWVSYDPLFNCGDRAGVDWTTVGWRMSEVWR